MLTDAQAVVPFDIIKAKAGRIPIPRSRALPGTRNINTATATATATAIVREPATNHPER